MRFGFVTAVQLGLKCLEEIYEVGGTVDLLVTLRDDIAPKKSGRVFLDGFSALHNVRLHKIRNVNDPDAIAVIDNAGLDWLFIIGWSQIAGREILESPSKGCIGIHPTLLPVGRGRASIPWAILKGLDETGVTMFKLDEGVDTGPIIGQISIPIASNETATSLYAKVETAHRALMHDEYPRLRRGEVELAAQNESLATVWPGRTPADGLLRETMSVAEMDRLVRATTHPYPGAFVVHSDASESTIWAGSIARVAGATPIRGRDGDYWATDTSTC